MEINEKELKEEVERKRTKLINVLCKEPDIENFKKQFKKVMKKNEEFNNKIKKSNRIDVLLLLKPFTI